jgi:AcrR family transcriptional regulator
MSAMPFEPLTPERRRAQTRAHLLAAAGEVFARDGYAGASLDEVAERAGFSKGAVYSNFANKEDLFLALMAEQTEKLIAEFGQAAEQAEGAGAGAKIDALSEVYLRREATEQDWVLWTEFLLFALRRPELRAKLVADSRTAQATISELVERHSDEVGLRLPLPATHVARIYLALFSGLWQQKALDPEAVDDELLAESIVYVRDGLDALGRPSGRARPRGRKVKPS